MTDTFLIQGRKEASQGNWQGAFDLLAQAHKARSLTDADETLFADVAYAAGRLDITLEVWERAYARSLSAGDSSRASLAATRMAMHLLFDTALLAPVRGWVKRAEELVESNEETAVNAWLAVVRNYERLLSGDFRSAREWARRAIDIGSTHDAGAAAIGRIAEARSLILGSDDVKSGIELLNDAAMQTLTGELDSLATGLVYCELVCALQAMAQYDLAEEWTRAMEQWRHGNAVGSTHGRCRVHRAEILRLRGALVDAEKEALLACEELRPYLRREFGWPLTELGRIRLRKGELNGAEQAFLEAHRRGWDPHPGLAKVYLARGDVALAAVSIRDALKNPMKVPSKESPPNSDLWLAPLLEAQAEIAAAAGDLESARWASQELGKIADKFGSKALRADAAIARGRTLLLAGEPEKAGSEFESAVQLWSDVGAPYETARARLGLGDAHRRNGNEARARLELRAAQSTFEQIGAALDVQTAMIASRLLEKHEFVGHETAESSWEESPTHGVSSNLNIYRREGEYWSITFVDRTVRLRDLKGLRYLARLLEHPGREFLALDLVVLERGDEFDATNLVEPGRAAGRLGDAGNVLDSRAKRAYKRRLTEIEEDIEHARALQDHEREAQAEAERDFVVRELARAIGLDGSDRKQGSASERARVSVTRAMRSAMRRLREHHVELGEHLNRSIRTGTYCAYLPDPRVPVQWVIKR